MVRSDKPKMPAGGQDGEEPVRRLSSGRSLLYVKEYSMTQYAGERAVRTEADELEAIPKKFKVFTFKPFNEMMLKNARIITYWSSGGREASKPDSTGDERWFSFPGSNCPQTTSTPKA